MVDSMFLDNCTQWEVVCGHCMQWLGIIDINNVGIENPMLLSLTCSHNTIPSQSSIHRGAETTALHTRLHETRA